MYNNKVNDGSYFAVEAWMRTKLNLKGNHLLIFALIYGFTVNSAEQKFYGSQEYIQEWFGITPTTVIKILRELTKAELLMKTSGTKLGFVSKYVYTANLEKIEELKNSTSKK